MYVASPNNLTLDHLKREARHLLHGLQQRDPYALRRYDAVDSFSDVSGAALDDARFVIAHEHGFSSWRKLKEHTDNLRRWRTSSRFLSMALKTQTGDGPSS